MTMVTSPREPASAREAGFALKGLAQAAKGPLTWQEGGTLTAGLRSPPSPAEIPEKLLTNSKCCVLRIK